MTGGSPPVVTLGESMALLDAPASGRLGPGASLPLGFGGAESNVAIGLTRLRVPCTWVSRVGDDALGTFVTRELRAEGVHVAATRDHAGAPDGGHLPVGVQPGAPLGTVGRHDLRIGIFESDEICGGDLDTDP